MVQVSSKKDLAHSELMKSAWEPSCSDVMRIKSFMEYSENQKTAQFRHFLDFQTLVTKATL